MQWVGAKQKRKEIPFSTINNNLLSFSTFCIYCFNIFYNLDLFKTKTLQQIASCWWEINILATTDSARNIQVSHLLPLVSEKTAISLYYTALPCNIRFVCLPHWNSSAPSSQSFWPSHSHTLEMQFPLGQAKWPSSHFCPWETGKSNTTTVGPL